MSARSSLCLWLGRGRLAPCVLAVPDWSPNPTFAALDELVASLVHTHFIGLMVALHHDADRHFPALIRVCSHAVTI
jgi:hypothetical protein